jgi:hypothetical protein
MFIQILIVIIIVVIMIMLIHSSALGRPAGTAAAAARELAGARSCAAPWPGGSLRIPEGRCSPSPLSLASPPGPPARPEAASGHCRRRDP